LKAILKIRTDLMGWWVGENEKMNEEVEEE
jgi:hypothetical protein